MKQPLSDSIDDYVAHLTSRALSVSWLKSNRVVLRRFLTATGNILTENIHEGHVDAYFVKASETRSARSLGVDTAILKGFFKWAVRTKRAGKNGDPTASRTAPKAAPREWRGFHVSKVPALLGSATHPRDRILLALACFLLGRSVEFTLLRISDVDLAAGHISYRIPKSFKVDLLPISEELDEELRGWFTWYGEHAGTLDPNWYLVPAKTAPLMAGRGPVNRRNEVLKPTRQMRDAHKIAQKALVAIGYPVKNPDGTRRHEGMHTIRRSMARALHDQLRDEGDPNPVETVRSMLNHATEGQTRRYIGLESSRVHRDARLKGRLMFPSLRAGNVSELDAFRRERTMQDTGTAGS
jgi:integrase